MHKRCVALLLLALLAAGCLSPAGALAYTPAPPSLLEYDSLRDVEGLYHYLLISYDEFRNTDGLLLISLDMNARRIMCTSISREILVQRPDGGIGRITYIVKNYSADDLCRIISTHFGVKVTKYYITDYDMVDEIIDNIGGIDLHLSSSEARYMREGYEIPNYYTKPVMGGEGDYWLCGRAAILYMRMRKGVGGDDGRTGRIRNVISTLVKKYENCTLDEALSLLELVVANSYESNLSMQEFMQGVGFAMDLRGVEVESIQMPTTESMTSVTYAGMSTREVDYAMSREALAGFMGVAMGDLSEWEVTE